MITCHQAKPDDLHRLQACFIITQIRGLYQTVPERSIASVFNYASAAVMIAMEYTSDALHPRDKSLIGAFNPRRIGTYD